MYRSNRCLRYAALVVTLGTCFQLGSCIGGATRYVANFNPCGTILNCDPTLYDAEAAAYRFITSGYEGPGVDPDIDPACTYPPFCDGDPFAPNAGGTAP